jgi:hypothetical protein
MFRPCESPPFDYPNIIFGRKRIMYEIGASYGFALKSMIAAIWNVTPSSLVDKYLSTNYMASH